MSGKKGMKHYPLGVKLEAVRLHEEEGKSCQEIASLLGVKSRKRVEEWMKDYRAEGLPERVRLSGSVGGGGSGKRKRLRIQKGY